MKKYLSILLISLFAVTSRAQRHEILSPRIASLQVTADDNWTGLPITDMDGRIHINFDDLTHEYTRYTYRIEHCEADWTP